MPGNNHIVYEATTRGLRISVEPQYLPDESDPEDGKYYWAYHVEIFNEGSESVQLLTRHWLIRDSMGRVQEVRGPGVVGVQPVIEPGDSYNYTSSAPLTTSHGIMQGSYQMLSASGEHFDADIPAFFLESPETLASPH